MAVVIEVEVKGLAEAVKSLQSIPGAWDVVIEDTAKTIRSLVERNSPVGDPAVDPHAGELKSSWSAVQKMGISTFSFSTDVPYSVVLEEGLYTSVGPRTVALEGGIFSRQAPGGMVAPLFRNDELVNQIMSGIIQQIEMRVR